MPKISFVATSHTQAMSRLLLVGDALLIAATIPFAYLVQDILRSFLVFIKTPPDIVVFSTLVILILPIWLFLITVFGLHEIFDRLWKTHEMIVALLKLHAVLLVVITLVVFLTQVVMNRSLIAIYLACTFAVLYFERILLQLRMRYRLRQGSTKKHILLVGDESEDMRRFIEDSIEADVQTLFVGRIGKEDARAENPPANPAYSLPSRVGDIDDLGELLHTKAVDQVMFFPPLNDPASTVEALKECEALGVPACFFVQTSRPLMSAPKLVLYQRFPFFVFEVASKRPEALAVKYTLDTLAAGVGLILISPLLLLVTLSILITMGRPVIFSQVRSGLFGREFRMFKLRTMVRGAESRRDELLEMNEMDGPVFKIAKDPRITKLGGFLRKWSIDELPQLLNVLMGDMSLVGPRPLPIKEQKDIVGWRRRRLSMRPGITGLWQVMGRNEVDFEEWMKLDLKYIDNWSLWLDFKILVRTAKVVLTGKGAC